MKNFIAFMAAALLLGATAAKGEDRDPLLIMFWNVENFFDWEDAHTSPSDAEFSARGARHWTKRRFYAKCGLIAKTVMYIADREGRLPDVIGLAEVENERVVTALLSSTLLGKCSYRALTFPSPDPRGIDVALLFNERTLRLVSARPAGVFLQDGARLPTRDILVATFETRERGEGIGITVNHHPSKYGGAASEARRAAAVGQLSCVSDSLSAAGWVRQVHVGDFNDVPSSPLYDTLKEKMCSLAAPLEEKGEGSIRFDGRWEIIDQAFVVPAGAGATMKVCAIPFLTTRDSAHSGTKPLRTYSGPRYLGGVSDHYPILVWIH